MINIWNKLKYLKLSEKWGDPDKMSWVLLLCLDTIREEINKPLIVNCGFETSGHSAKSAHYQGKACDFHFDKTILTEDLLSIDEIMNNFKVPYGLGVYPFWNNKGFHLDVGFRTTTTYWVSKEQNKYYYQSDIKSLLKIL